MQWTTKEMELRQKFTKKTTVSLLSAGYPMIRGHNTWTRYPVPITGEESSKKVAIANLSSGATVVSKHSNGEDCKTANHIKFHQRGNGHPPIKHQGIVPCWETDSPGTNYTYWYRRSSTPLTTPRDSVSMRIKLLVELHLKVGIYRGSTREVTISMNRLSFGRSRAIVGWRHAERGKAKERQ
jgi:hypothetical protein